MTGIDFEALGRSFYDWASKQGIIMTAGGGAQRPQEAQAVPPQFLTIPELAQRWRIARPTVYARLQKLGIKVIDLSPGSARGRKVVPRSAILEVERRQLKRI